MTWTPERRREYQREYQRAWRARNPEKVKQIRLKSSYNGSEQQRAWKARNRVKLAEQARVLRAKNPGRREHGHWIKEDRAAMWTAQDGKCYLCGKPMDDPRLIRIDHDHACCPQGKSCRTCRRGLAHHRCNIAIGYAGDDPALLRHMADALEQAQIAFLQRKNATPESEHLF